MDENRIALNSIAGLSLVLLCLPSAALGQPGWRQSTSVASVTTQQYCPPGQGYCVPQPRYGDAPVGVQGTPQFVPSPPLVPVQPIPQQPSIQQPLQPDCCEELRAMIVALQARIAALESRKPQAGPPGETGPIGPPGPTGATGIAGATPEIDYNRLADAAASKWVFHFRVVDPTGKYTTTPVAIHNGEQLNLVLEPVNDAGVPGLSQPTVEAK